MKKYLSIAALAVASIATGFSVSALAADMPARAPIYKATPVPAFSWTGAYAGIQGGWGWGDIDHVRDFLFVPDRTGSLHGDGGLAGGTLGYNWQSGAVVLGIEADYGWSDIRVDGRNGEVFPVCTGGGLGTCGATLENFGTVRGRLGYAVDRVLFYGTAGLGFGDLKSFASHGGAIGSGTNFSTGFVFGGGIEAMVASNWSLKVEYLHYDAGDGSKFLLIGDPRQVEGWTADIVRVGLNYKFGY